MIKPDAYNNIGKIVDIIERQFRISKMKMVRFTREIAEGKSCSEAKPPSLSHDLR